MGEGVVDGGGLVVHGGWGVSWSFCGGWGGGGSVFIATLQQIAVHKTCIDRVVHMIRPVLIELCIRPVLIELCIRPVLIELCIL